MNNRKCCVYQIYNNKGDAIYIGVSVNPNTRLHTHLRKKEWAEEVSTININWYESELEAIKNESMLVFNLKPKYNIRLTDKEENKPKGVKIKDRCKTDLAKLCWRIIEDEGGINYIFKKYKEKPIGFDYSHLSCFLIRGSIPNGVFPATTARNVCSFFYSKSGEFRRILELSNPRLSNTIKILKDL